MQFHEALDVAKAQVSLLREGVVASFLEVIGAQLNLRRVLLFVQVLADLHNLV